MKYAYDVTGSGVKKLQDQPIDGGKLADLSKYVIYLIRFNQGKPHLDLVVLHDGVYLYNPISGGHDYGSVEEMKEKHQHLKEQYKILWQKPLKRQIRDIIEAFKKYKMTISAHIKDNSVVTFIWEEAKTGLVCTLKKDDQQQVTNLNIDYHAKYCIFDSLVAHIKEELERKIQAKIYEEFTNIKQRKIMSPAWRMYMHWLLSIAYNEKSYKQFEKNILEVYLFTKNWDILREHGDDYEVLTKKWVHPEEYEGYVQFYKKKRLENLFQ